MDTIWGDGAVVITIVEADISHGGSLFISQAFDISVAPVLEDDLVVKFGLDQGLAANICMNIFQICFK